MPGQDSFLDVAANLVGILIILVMVVGAHAKNSFIVGELPPVPAPPPQVDVASAEAAAADVERSMAELEGKINRQAAETAFREAERNQLQLVVALAEDELAKSRAAMTEEDRAEYDLAHMWLEPELRGNLRFAYYGSGHMVYLHAESHHQMKADLAKFYDDVLGR